jgi:flagellar biogenesis protein FliO
MDANLGASSLGSVVTSLAVILLLLAVAGFVLRRLRGGGAWTGGAQRGRIEIVAARQIGWQSSLLIVEADGARFLVGAGRNGLTPIGPLNNLATLPPALPAETAS